MERAIFCLFIILHTCPSNLKHNLVLSCISCTLHKNLKLLSEFSAYLYINDIIFKKQNNIKLFL